MINSAMEVAWNSLSHREWERFADATDAGLQQRWTYGETVQDLGGSVERLVLTEGGNPVLLAQMVVRDFGTNIGLISRGPLWAGAPSYRAWRVVRQAIRDRGIRLLLCTTPDPQVRGMGVRIMTPTTCVQLALGGALTDRMHGKWRNRLRVAQGSELKVKTLGTHPTKFEWLLSENRAQQRAKGFRGLPASFTRAWGNIAPRNLLTLAAMQGKVPVAAMMFLRHGASATYHIGWSNDDGRRLNAHNLLLWHAAQALQDDGVTSIDLGTLDTVNAPGLARFKLGSGARPVELGATWASL